MEKAIYNFKKSDADSDIKRKEYLINITKYKYHTNQEFKDKMKIDSKTRYNKLIEAYKTI